MTKPTTNASNNESRSWRELVSTHRLAMAVLAGILATHIATITGYWYHGIGMPDLDWPRFNGYLLERTSVLAAGGKVPAGVFAAPDTVRLVLGWIAHTFTGVAFAVLYAVAIHPKLPWRNTTFGNMAKALVFGLVLATISAAWWTPKLLPEFQAGFFSSNLGWKTVLGIYLWHIVWSVHLAVIYNPLPAERSSAEAAAAPSVDVRIAEPATA